MAYLISDVNKLHNELRVDVLQKFLAPKLFLDSPIMVIPFILKTRNGKYFLYREQEQGNLNSINIPSDVTIAPYKPYFIVGKDNSLITCNLPEKIKEILSYGNNIESELHINRNLPYCLYKDLCEKLKKVKILKERATFFKKPCFVYSIKTEKIIEKFISIRGKAQSYASKLIMNSPDKDILKDEIVRITDSRFSLLNSIMKECNFSAIMMNSLINIQELTGLSFQNIHYKICAIYRINDDEVFIISEEEINNRMGINKKGIYLNYFEALESIVSKKEILGFEDYLISASEYDLFKEKGFLLSEGTLAYRKWREYRAGEDLVFYIIAGKASDYAMEKVLNEAYTLIVQSNFKSEKYFFNRYMEYFQEFKIIHKIPYNFLEYFTNFYASNRTLYPSVPTDFIITKNTNEIKIDAGILMVDSSGLILGSTDIARTLPLSVQSKRIYHLMKNIIKNLIIPNIKNANTFEDVYIQGLETFFADKCEFLLKEMKLCPPNFTIKNSYLRDIGHLMGKQESFDEQIIKGNRNIIRNNIIGCIEIQWQYKNHAIAYEDMWYKGRDGICNITG